MTFSFGTWKEGKVAPTRHDVPVDTPKYTIKLEPVSPRLKRELIHPNRSALLIGLRFSPDGKRLIAGDYPGGVIQVWDADNGKQLTKVETGYGYRGSAEYLYLSPDWKTLYVSRSKRKYERVDKDGKRLMRWTFDGSVRAWDLGTGRLKRTYRHDPPRNVLGMELSPDGSRFVTFDELPGTYESVPRRGVSVWDVETGKHRDLPRGLQSYGIFSPDGRSLVLTAVDEDGYARAVKVFDPATGREQVSIPVRSKHAWVTVTDFSPDGRLVVGEERVFAGAKKWDEWEAVLKWWDTATGREAASFPAHKNETFSRPRFSPDGRTLAVLNWQSDKRRLYLFDVPGRELARTVELGAQQKGQRLLAMTPAFSPDGKWLAVVTQAVPDLPGGGDLDVRDVPQARIHLVDVKSAEVRETLVSPQGFARSLCFSPDGRTLATGGLGRVLLWDLSRAPAAGARARR